MRMSWSYGVTTVPERRDTLLPRTLESLASAGLGSPMVFVDAPRLRCVGRWMLSLLELYLRDPRADRYALFQDDVVVCRGLVARCEAFAPGLGLKGYMNCYSMPRNFALNWAVRSERGWVESRQRGIGALATVFDGDGCRAMLGATHMLNKVRSDTVRAYTKVDGGIVASMRAAGYREYIHVPSLVDHLGDEVSTVGSKPDERPRDFDLEFV